MSQLSLLTISKRHMATDFQLELVVDPSSLRKGDSVLAEAHAEIAAIEDEISEFREESAVYRLNHSKVGEWIVTGPHLRRVLELSREFEQSSRGYFSALAKSTSPADVNDLEFDPGAGRLRRMNPDLWLSFAAVGKGYALDRVRILLEREGFADFRLSSGGSSWIMAGTSATGEPWTIAWGWRRDLEGELFGRVLRLRTSENIAIGVSGTLEQGQHFFFRGKKSDSRVVSAFYAGRSAAEADALSTALFVGASFAGEGILTTLANKIRNPILAYVDLEEQMIYNQAFGIRFINTGK